jgi:hypothetical protein
LARKRLLAAAAAVLVLVASLPLVLLGEAYRQRELRFPVLFGFDSLLEMRFITTRDATVELTRPPAGWNPNARRRVARLTCHPPRFPAMHLHDPYPDWEAYGFLELDLYLEGDRGASIAVLINDELVSGDHTDRYRGRFSLEPGPNQLRISLAEVRHAPESREMNMRRIRDVIFVAARPAEQITLYLAGLRLAPD